MNSGDEIAHKNVSFRHAHGEGSQLQFLQPLQAVAGEGFPCGIYCYVSRGIRIGVHLIVADC